MPTDALKTLIIDVRNTPKSEHIAHQMQQIEVPIDAIMEHVKNNQTSINKIEIKPFKLASDFPIDGKALRLGDTAKIYLNESTLNYCGKRFIITKELVHLLLHGRGLSSATQNVTDLIEKLIHADMKDFTSYPSNVKEDILANHGAMELLMPQNNIPTLMDIWHTTGSIRDVAIACRVPVKAVEFRLKVAPHLFK